MLLDAPVRGSSLASRRVIDNRIQLTNCPAISCMPPDDGEII